MPKPDPPRQTLLISQLLDPQPRPVTRADIARVARQSEAMISMVISGKRAPNEAIRRAASLLLGRPADELFAPVEAAQEVLL